MRHSKVHPLGLTLFVFLLLLTAVAYFYVTFGSEIVLSTKRFLILAVGIFALSFTFANAPFVLRALSFSRVSTAMLVSLMIIPHFTIIKYPFLKFFQQTSEITISFDLESGNLKGIDFDKLKFNNGNHIYKVKDFDLSNVLFWQGKVTERAKFYGWLPVANGTMTVDWDGETTTVDLDGSYFSLTSTYTAPASFIALTMFLSFVNFFVVIFLFMAIYDGFLFSFNPKVSRIFLVFLLIAFSGVVLLVQVHRFRDLENVLIINYGWHEDVLRGVAPNPWQNRVLAEWILNFVVKRLSYLGISEEIFYSYLLVRFIQNIFIFFFAYLYYRKTHFSKIHALFGVILLAGSMINLTYGEGFFLNTYFDLIFYLLGGLLPLFGFVAWMPILMFFAALNRETSGLMPVLAIVKGLFYPASRWKLWMYAIWALVVWVVVYLGLRYTYPNQPIFYYEGITPGIPLLFYNLTNPYSFYSLFVTLGVLPLLGLIAVFLKTTNEYKIAYFLIGGIWFIAHLFGGIVAESRLFLVPQALLYIPGGLYLLKNNKQKSDIV